MSNLIFTLTLALGGVPGGEREAEAGAQHGQVRPRSGQEAAGQGQGGEALPGVRWRFVIGDWGTYLAFSLA